MSNGFDTVRAFSLYFESHVTVEPLEPRSSQAFLFEELCKKHKFRPAMLLMQKDRAATQERSNKDAFCTGHDLDGLRLAGRTMQLLSDLSKAGIKPKC